MFYTILLKIKICLQPAAHDPQYAHSVRNFRSGDFLIHSILAAANADTCGSSLIANLFKSEIAAITLYQSQAGCLFLLLRRKVQKLGRLPSEMTITHTEIGWVRRIPQGLRAQPETKPSLPFHQ